MGVSQSAGEGTKGDSPGTSRCAGPCFAVARCLDVDARLRVDDEPPVVTEMEGMSKPKLVIDTSDAFKEQFVDQPADEPVVDRCKSPAHSMTRHALAELENLESINTLGLDQPSPKPSGLTPQHAMTCKALDELDNKQSFGELDHHTVVSGQSTQSLNRFLVAKASSRCTSDMGIPSMAMSSERLAPNSKRLTRATTIEGASLIRKVDDMAPFRVVHFPDFRDYGRIPRSDACLAQTLEDLGSAADNAKFCFISHRWIRPWKRQDETEAAGHKWEGSAHPDNEYLQKFHLIVKGITNMAAVHGWDHNQVYVWVDFACVEQDDQELKMRSIKSLLGYLSMCSYVLVPCLEAPKYEQVHSLTGEYAVRAWTRLEAFGFYVMALVAEITNPFMYCTSPAEPWGTGKGVAKLQQIRYVLLPYLMPHLGEIHTERDRIVITQHEETMLKLLHCAALDGVESARSVAMVAAAGLGHRKRVSELLTAGMHVDTQDPHGITALWAAARQKQVKVVEFLLRHEAGVNIANDQGPALTPLHCAAKAGCVETMRKLVDANADLHAKTKSHETPLILAVSEGNCDAAKALLDLDVSSKHVAAVLKMTQLLIEDPALKEEYQHVHAVVTAHWKTSKSSVHPEWKEEVDELVNGIVAKKRKIRKR